MDTEDFRLSDDHFDVKVMLQRTHMTVLKLSAEALEHMQCLLHRLAHILRGWQIFLPVVTQHTDPESLYILPQRRTVIRDVTLDTASIAGIKSSNGLHNNGAIFDGAGEWPAMIEGVRVGDDTRTAYPAGRRHQANHTAQRSRTADRAASIGAKCHWHQSCGHGRTGATRGAASKMRQMPRIARRRPWQIEGRPAVRKFVRGQLAHEDRTGLAELTRSGRVGVGNALEAHFGMP